VEGNLRGNRGKKSETLRELEKAVQEEQFANQPRKNKFDKISLHNTRLWHENKIPTYHLHAILIHLTADLLIAIKHVENISTPLPIDLMNRPQRLIFTLPFVALIDL